VTYDPQIGKWLQEDPDGFSAGDPNLYRFVGNAPTNETDPSGLRGEGPILPTLPSPAGPNINALLEAANATAPADPSIYALVEGTNAKGSQEWSQRQVINLLGQSAIGKQTLDTLKKINVWKVDRVRFFYQTREKKTDPWPKEWKNEDDLGLRRNFNGKITLFITRDQSALDAAMTLVHEATHARQEMSGKTYGRYDREKEAFTAETQFLLSLPQYIKSAPARYQKFIDKDGKTVNAEAVEKYVKQTYTELAPDAGDKIQYRKVTREIAFPFGTLKPGENEIDFGRVTKLTGW
jgi:hypothetical protein